MSAFDRSLCQLFQSIITVNYSSHYFQRLLADYSYLYILASVGDRSLTKSDRPSQKRAIALKNYCFQ
ncbi:MAG: hypothetical protein ACRC62_04055 [Microcoleus sp.]